MQYGQTSRLAAYFMLLRIDHSHDRLDSPMFPKILQFIAVLAAAAILGNWFLAEHKKAKSTGQPWYRAYFSLPGIIIAVLIIVLPIVARLA
jgi:hypothetical protein